jgi:hypothetical protein
MARLIAYDADGNVIATLDWLVRPDDGLADFAVEHDADHIETWNVEGAKGSKVWEGPLPPGPLVVELTGPPGRKRIANVRTR